ncbi:MAG: PQQ-dependent sugar dehydrogenase [Minisyncoccia bacterium]
MYEDYRPKGRKFLLVVAVFALSIVGANFYLKSGIEPPPPAVTPPLAEEAPIKELPARTTDVVQSGRSARATSVATGFSIPWEVAFLPTGEMLVTERPGRLVKINGFDKLTAGGETRETIAVKGVRHSGEGGLLGLALHPDFASNNFVYLYFTAAKADGVVNKVVRYVLHSTVLVEDRIILDEIPGSANHNGGRIAFGPDGLLYITTGDAGDASSAQDPYSLAGKILRVTALGKVPPDNPFNNEVYSYGHRNPQGLAWDNLGRLWATEHGRSGLQSGYDEINLIEKGANYGWPDIEGDETAEGMRAPVLHSGADTTWAPAGLVFHSGKLYWAGLRGAALYEAEITPEGKLTNPKSYFAEQFGRLRAVALGPDGLLYLSTSNTDGRGRLREGDDRIIKVGFE